MKTPAKKHFPPETIGRVMSANVPVCHADDTLEQILEKITSRHWASVRNVYVVDEAGKLLGYIGLGELVQHGQNSKARALMQEATERLNPRDDQEKAVFLAVRDNAVVLPVVDNSGRFLGAVTARKVIGIMHDEHLEDALLASGVRDGKGVQIAKLATERTALIVRNRAPWLVAGLAVGLGLGFISSFFEESLQETVALVYFIPVVAYIADSVGAQSEAIAVRALATLKLNNFRYLTKELLTGLSLGVLMGVLGGVGAAFIGQSASVGLAVGLSLFVASTVAAMLASGIPMLFKALGKDPALATAPLATALQDVISILIYFGFAAWLV